MNIRNNSSINDNQLVDFIESTWSTSKKEYKREKDIEVRDKILISLAKILRQYINSVRTKQAGVQPKYKRQAHEMIVWLQSELLKAGWSPAKNTILQAISYGRKHCGNIAIEGVALKRPLSERERKKLARLRRDGEKRALHSLEHIDLEDVPLSGDNGGPDLLPGDS